MTMSVWRMVRRADFAGDRRESDSSVGRILVWNMQGHAGGERRRTGTRKPPFRLAAPEQVSERLLGRGCFALSLVERIHRHADQDALDAIERSFDLRTETPRAQRRHG